MHEEWLTASDLAEMLNLKYQTIFTYRSRNTLPEPDSYIGRTPIWKKETVQEFINKKNEIEVVL